MRARAKCASATSSRHEPPPRVAAASRAGDDQRRAARLRACRRRPNSASPTSGCSKPSAPKCTSKVVASRVAKRIGSASSKARRNNAAVCALPVLHAPIVAARVVRRSAPARRCCCSTRCARAVWRARHWSDTLLLVGPEGGFSDAERAAAQASGARCDGTRAIDSARRHGAAGGARRIASVVGVGRALTGPSAPVRSVTAASRTVLR